MYTIPADMSFPVDNATTPLWRTELHPLDDLRTTPELPAESEIVIIGAGYTGVSIAYHLLKDRDLGRPCPSITIVEARQVCSGATGRNGKSLGSIVWLETDELAGGHIRPDIYGLIPTYIERHGLDAGVEVAEFEMGHIKALKEVIAKESIDCDFNITRNMNVYLNETDCEKAKHAYDTLAARGLSIVDDLHYTPAKHAERVC